ncbi:major facilitator superfamily domain-containing protein [Zopfochytrium polystomum]|nr:major facilitator superfamily domain-containing protein [Zopfochytrium polystomum]
MADSDKKEVETAIEKKVDIEADIIGPIDPAQERIILRKIDIRIIPWMLVMYLLSFLDRVNIGNARILGSNAQGVGTMEIDLHLTGSQYNWALSTFFIGYIIFEVPSNLLLKKLKPSRWLARIMFTWGIIATSMGFVQNWGGLMAVRTLLGIAEAGLLPGLIFYSSFWYRRHELAQRQSLFFAGASASGACAGLIAYGINNMNGAGGWPAWRWVFILEGIPTILFGASLWFFLPDFPGNAPFLTEEERKIATDRLALDHIDANDTSFSLSEFLETLIDPGVWMLMFMYAGMATSAYSVSYFLPSIIRGMGYSAAAAQAMVVPPFFCGAVFTVVSGYVTDRLKERSGAVIVSSVIACASFFGLAYGPVTNNGLRYFLCITGTTCSFSPAIPLLAWSSNNNRIGTATRQATASAMVIAFGNIGGIIAGQIYRTSDAPQYQLGHIVVGSGWVMVLVLAITLRIAYTMINANKDKIHGKLTAEDVSDVGRSRTDMITSFKDKRFRYQL